MSSVMLQKVKPIRGNAMVSRKVLDYSALIQSELRNMEENDARWFMARVNKNCIKYIDEHIKES